MPRPEWDEDDPYDYVVKIQDHNHSEPVCAWPDCETYLTRTQMAELLDKQGPVPTT